MHLFGIKLVGFNHATLHKLIITLALFAALFALRWLLSLIMRQPMKTHALSRGLFWTRQGIQLALALILILGTISIWLDDPAHLTTALGLVSAGLAFALQKPISALAGYFVILRGKTFNVGDRISMGGVRGDVIALGFIQTTIMEMGQPPAVQSADPAIWVRSRQFTGRIVTVSNSQVFDEPVFNYTRDFPYLWEEMMIPVTYQADRKRAEAILLQTANRHTQQISDISEDALRRMRENYAIRTTDFEPRVYYRLTDNWLELTVRFVVHEHGVRDIKDAMSRDIVDALDEAGIGIASATYDIVGLPPVRVQDPRSNGAPERS